MTKPALPAAALLAAILAQPALAHTGHGTASGLGAGLLHPLFGPDHLLAMLAVGLWSGFAMPARLWAGAATFLSAMTFGAALSWGGVALPGVEPAILASVVAFGLLLLLSRPGQGARLTLASLAAIGAFATAHGHAHAAEATGALLPYLAGFLSASAALHLAGIVLARALAGADARQLAQRALGVAIAGGGLWMAAG